MRLQRFSVVLICAMFGVNVCVHADRVELDKPLRMMVQDESGANLAATITSYDEHGFTLLDRENQELTLTWNTQKARVVHDIHIRTMDVRSAEALYELSRLLGTLADGKLLSERILARAKLIDPQIESRMNPAGVSGGDEVSDSGDKANYWEELTAEEHAKSVEHLKKHAENAQKKLNIALSLIETEYFLFYSDLSRDEAFKWGSLLDNMYHRLCAMFAIPKKTNIWRGKALVYVFSTKELFHHFEYEIYKIKPGNAAGHCYPFSDGHVHITFYRQPDEMTFAHILVHEAAHGFVHRYRTPVHVPSWANEGLVEVVGEMLVPQGRQVANKEHNARKELKKRKSMGKDFFTARQIDGWQYGVASLFTKYMIEQNRNGYIDFINAIKAGVSVDEAFEKHYGASRKRVIGGFSMWLGIPLD